ncbi:hypothetical protein FA95DRAFT_264157 [Auriscalpium vulgare]|uniref:Uncharacterized protein n=1 Tax=Auriscalpium vulgare TaxID=40419 RepID=A0ACB8RKJ4_9AGAM|nr:hypothetical protein FA95DRAFT_264157 [Auriscalpium vulgare]
MNERGRLCVRCMPGQGAPCALTSMNIGRGRTSNTSRSASQLLEKIVPGQALSSCRGALPTSTNTALRRSAFLRCLCTQDLSSRPIQKEPFKFNDMTRHSQGSQPSRPAAKLLSTHELALFYKNASRETRVSLLCRGLSSPNSTGCPAACCFIFIASCVDTLFAQRRTERAWPRHGRLQHFLLNPLVATGD